MLFIRSLLQPSTNKDRSLLPIAGVVIALHFLFVGWAALFNHSKPSAKIPPPRLVVQTITLSPPQLNKTTTEALAAGPTVPMQPAAPELPPKAEEEAQEEVPEPEPEIADEVAYGYSLGAPSSPSRPPPDSTPPKPHEELAPKQPEKPATKQPEKPKPKPKPKPPKPVPKKENKKPAPTTVPVKKQETKQEPKKKPPATVKPNATKKTETKKNETKKPAKVQPKKNVTPPKEPKKEKPAPKPAEDKELQRKKEAEQQKKIAERQKREAEEQAIKDKQYSLVAKAQERIAKIAQTRDKVTPGKGSEEGSTSVPSAITSLQIDAVSTSNAAPLSDREVSYRDELAGRLKLLLRLPEYGEVKIKLTLDRTGKIAKVNVLNSESAANKKYIEKTLPTLSFPAFGTRFGDVDEYIFSITLSNEL